VTSIEIELRSSAPPAGAVALVNTRDVAVRTWRLGNEWGDQMISFEVVRGEAMTLVVRAPQVYTRNVPSPISVPAGARHPVPFDLGDGTWRLEAPASEVFAAGASLVAVYEVPESREASEAGVR